MLDVEDQKTASDSQASALSHRRPPAHQSVSLLHSPRPSLHQRRIRQKPAVGFASDISVRLSQPTCAEKNSSGESSNAEKWFEKSNNNVKPGAAELDDNDPPFFLRNSSSSEASPNMVNDAQPQPHNASLSLPFRAPCFPPNSQDDTSDEFRSVIDDLTIENKKLRKKLRRYEKLHDTHLQADKLFEIRIHRLPPDKRRELEETLQKFAADLDTPQSSNQSGKTTERFAAKLQTASSLANTDSGYASMSGQNQSLQSGQNQSLQSGHGNNVRAMPQPGMSQEQQQNIQSYLHEIPVGLFPQHRTAMTEKARRKLVVRRMEQIFVGKGAAISGHQQPMQQQEVSNSAAHADRVDQGREGREHDLEGSREARIVPISKHHGESKSNATRIDQYAESMDVDRRPPRGDDGSDDSPDQRPTRPLDLDPHRAQVPSDNIRYMRHLGFSPPEVGANANLADDHGWVYLNVLTNMAQLHTINVTVDFVKRSISEYSDKLELSPDGRKVRWKGGASLTRTSSDGSPDDAARGLMAITGKSMDAPDMFPGMISKSAMKQTVNKLAYKPLFFRQEEPSDSEEEESATWTSPPRINGESGGMDSEGQLQVSPRRRRGDDGPIIFYNKAKFFTDLSGDNHGSKIDLGNVRHYSTNSLRPVGLSRNASLDGDDSSDKRGPLSKEGVIMTDVVDTDQSSTSDVVTGLSRPASSRTSSTEDISRSPINFEVSGIGGVHPSDNFSINVRSRQHLAAEASLPTISEAKIKHYTSRIQAILADTHLDSSQLKKGQRNAIVDEIIKSERKDLPASRLPDPSFYHFDGDGEESEDSSYDSDSETSGSTASTTAPDLAHRAVPTSAPQLMNWTAAPPYDADCGPSDDSEDGVDDQSMDGEDGDDDGSIDMLATAREIDPNLIRAREREYDGGVADRLAEEIPAGSSAATAGGGSGYNSPQLYHAGKKVPSLKRAREEGSSGERLRTKSPKLEGQRDREG
ncbi:frequency clock protein [Venturia nashicola]|nr:frequency clock protein [Venturia nashicola]